MRMRNYPTDTAEHRCVWTPRSGKQTANNFMRRIADRNCTCIVKVGESWLGGHCPNYKRNDPYHVHCIYMKDYMQCVYNESNLLPEDLFEI